MTGLTTSISALALALGVHRDTASKRIAEAGISPVETVRGFPRYRLGEALRAVLAPPAAVDPDQMTPRQRLDFYRAERLQRKLLALQSGLIPREQFHAELATAKTILREGLQALLVDLAGLLTPQQLEVARRHLTQGWPE